MGTIKLTLVVSNISDVIEYYDQIKVYRSTTGSDGVYTEISAAGTRPVLLEGSTAYEFVDTAGESTYWYKMAYYHSVDLIESDLSDPIQGESDPALGIISVEEVKNIYLVGTDLTTDDGSEYPPEHYIHSIRAAVSWMEAKLDIYLYPRVIEGERHDFWRRDYYSHMFVKLDRIPIISVEQVKLVLPAEQEVATFTGDNIQIEHAAGQINTIPAVDDISTVLLGQAGTWLPIFRSYAEYLPHVFRVDYTAGYEADQVPVVIKDLVGKLAAIQSLHIAGDLIVGAGIASQSISLDGLSQSINTTSSATNAGYGARIINWNKEIKEMIPQIRRSYHPIGLVAV